MLSRRITPCSTITSLLRFRHRRVQEWMGHADVQTTMKYLHFVPREQDAALIGEAFGSQLPAASSTKPTLEA